MTTTPWRWVDTTTSLMEACAAGVGETATVLATDTDDAELRALLALSLERLGCRVNEVIVRSGAVLAGEDPVDNEAVAAALLHSDLVVDVNGRLVERSRALDELLGEARVLAIDATSAADLDHLVAHPGLPRRVDRAQALAETASRLTISSPDGTDLAVDISAATIESRSGSAAQVGRVAHWPAGIVWVHPAPMGINGGVVLMPGDLAPEAGHIFRSPVRLEIEKGRLVEILGDSGDGDLVRSFLEHFDTGDAYELAAVGWGLNITRGVGELDLFDRQRLVVGRGTLSAGMVNLRAGQGERRLTFGMSRTTLYLDDVRIVDHGALDGAVAPDVYELAAGH